MVNTQQSFLNRLNGPTYVKQFDELRLRGQMRGVFSLMKDKRFRTIKEIQLQLGFGTETGISATLRSFRKERYGAHIVNRRRRGDPKQGLWEYSLEVNNAQSIQS